MRTALTSLTNERLALSLTDYNARVISNILYKIDLLIGIGLLKVKRELNLDKKYRYYYYYIYSNIYFYLLKNTRRLEYKLSIHFTTVRIQENITPLAL